MKRRKRCSKTRAELINRILNAARVIIAGSIAERSFQTRARSEINENKDRNFTIRPVEHSNGPLKHVTFDSCIGFSAEHELIIKKKQSIPVLSNSRLEEIFSASPREILAIRETVSPRREENWEVSISDATFDPPR